MEYYEEETVQDDGSYFEEEIIEEEVIEESVDDDEVVIVVGSNDGESDSGSGEYMDDDSSAPPPSVNSDMPAYDDNIIRGGEGGDMLTRQRASVQLEMQNAAVSEGARKAMEEELARERSIQRRAAKAALYRKRMEQEAAIRSSNSVEYNDDDGRKQTPQPQDSMHSRQLEDSARRQLAEEIRKVDRALSKSSDKKVVKTRVPRADEIEKKKKAIAALRRQAAREELARNNHRLKAAKASRRGSAGGVASLGDSPSSLKRASSLSRFPKMQQQVVSPTGSAPEKGSVARSKRTNIRSVDLSTQDPISPLQWNQQKISIPLPPPPLADETETPRISGGKTPIATTKSESQQNIAIQTSMSQGEADGKEDVSSRVESPDNSRKRVSPVSGVKEVIESTARNQVETDSDTKPLPRSSPKAEEDDNSTEDTAKETTGLPPIVQGNVAKRTSSIENSPASPIRNVSTNSKATVESPPQKQTATKGDTKVKTTLSPGMKRLSKMFDSSETAVTDFAAASQDVAKRRGSIENTGKSPSGSVKATVGSFNLAPKTEQPKSEARIKPMLSPEMRRRSLMFESNSSSSNSPPPLFQSVAKRRSSMDNSPTPTSPTRVSTPPTGVKARIRSTGNIPVVPKSDGRPKPVLSLHEKRSKFLKSYSAADVAQVPSAFANIATRRSSMGNTNANATFTIATRRGSTGTTNTKFKTTLAPPLTAESPSSGVKTTISSTRRTEVLDTAGVPFDEIPSTPKSNVKATIGLKKQTLAAPQSDGRVKKPAFSLHERRSKFLKSNSEADVVKIPAAFAAIAATRRNSMETSTNTATTAFGTASRNSIETTTRPSESPIASSRRKFGSAAQVQSNDQAKTSPKLSPEMRRRSKVFEPKKIAGVLASPGTEKSKVASGKASSPFGAVRKTYGSATSKSKSADETQQKPQSPMDAGGRSSKVFSAKVANVGQLPSAFQSSASQLGSGEKPASPAAADVSKGKFFALTDLQQLNIDGIDKAQREQYLAPAEFEKHFKMSKESFSKLPKWKRDMAKRSVGLF